MAGVGDAVEEGLVRSLARPGGNVTGVSVPYPALAAKQVELLKAAAPRLARLAVIWNPDATWRPDHLRRIEDAVRPLGVSLQSVEVRTPGDLDTAFAHMRRDNAGGLLVLPDSMVFVHRARIAALARQHHLPMATALAQFADAGGLLSYAPSLADVWQRAAFYADRILRGAKLADLPVEQPRTFELVVNLGTAKALGLSVPQSVLVQADRVIE
jgi:putative ABC transport system substrate-binding protein